MTSVINCSTSFFSGFIIFMILGYMAQRTGQPIEEVATEGKNCSPSFPINHFASFVLWKRIRRSYSPYYCRLYSSPNFTVANLFRHMHLLLLSPLFHMHLLLLSPLFNVEKKNDFGRYSIIMLNVDTRYLGIII